MVVVVVMVVAQVNEGQSTSVVERVVLGGGEDSREMSRVGWMGEREGGGCGCMVVMAVVVMVFACQ